MRAVACLDLANSTALIETLGDARAAELFRGHDRLARDLLREHGGQEVDKTDGFLLLFDRAIDVQVSRLRKLVEDNPSEPRYLQTVWGFGYVFVPDGAKT